VTSLDERPYCAIYIDHRGPTEVIEHIVAGFYGVKVTFAGIVTNQLEILVDHGDSYPPIEQRDYSKWINWKYRLEIQPSSDGVNEAEVAIPVKELLQMLQSVGIQAVPSCDFEELLSPFNWLSDQATL
jgi:hypothetical protein